MASRREFLKESGALVIGFSLTSTSLSAAEALAKTPPANLDAWLKIRKDESIQVLTGKVDIGMGIETALRQIVAEELDTLPERVSFVMGDTAETPDQGGVGGSTSISTGSRPLRNAAATARFLLVQLASTRLAVPVEDLEVRKGVVNVKNDPSRSLSYGALAEVLERDNVLRVSGNGYSLNVEGKGKPKDPAAYTVVGQSLPRADLALKILGRAIYVPDIRVEGMLHGRVVRPAIAGATLIDFDETACKSIPGFVKTVVNKNFVGVVAEKEWSAIRAARELKVNWSTPATPPLPDDIYEFMRGTTPQFTREGVKKGDTTAALAGAAKKLKASYEWPFQAHASMGPGCALADVRTDGITTVWSGSQKPHSLQKGIAILLHIPENQVRVIWVEDAGSYGRAGYEDVAADAALLSQAVGKPVRVQWMRADMTTWGGKGPAAVFELSAGLNEKGELTAVEFESRTFSGTEIIPQPDDPGNMLAGQLIGFPNKNTRNEFSQWGAETSQYNIPNVRSTSHIIAPLVSNSSPLRTTHLRDPGGPAGTFAAESFMDELAALAEIDPVAFRLKYVDEPRARAVLIATAEAMRWDPRPSPKRPASGSVASGRGIALALRGGTNVCTGAEVEVNLQSGAVKVKRLVCAHDCGLIINPDGLRGTIAGNLIQSMSRSLKEEVTFDRNMVTSKDWATYKVARASDIPEIEIVLLNHPELPPSGAGEPASRATAAAINNAIFDATGARVRRGPLTPARIKAALKS